jgi:putative Holliday junction resolvase
MPLKIVTGLSDSNKLNSISDIVELYSVCAIVLGLPISMDGRASQQTRIVQNFAENLKNIFNLPIYLQDERLTSRAADSLLKSFGMSRKERNSQDDSIAASMLLETTIDSIKKL